MALAYSWVPIILFGNYMTTTVPMNVATKVRTFLEPRKDLSRTKGVENYYCDPKGLQYTTLTCDNRDLTYQTHWLDDQYLTKLVLTGCAAGFLDSSILRSTAMDRLLVLELHFDKPYGRMDLAGEVAVKLNNLVNLPHVSLVKLKGLKDPNLYTLNVVAEKVKRGCVIEYDGVAFVKQ
jgi:hypothetical protein